MTHRGQNVVRIRVARSLKRARDEELHFGYYIIRPIWRIARIA